MASILRSRSRVLVPEEEGSMLRWQPPSNPTPDTVLTGVKNSESDSIVDTVTSDYQKLVNSGSIINNPCVYKKSGQFTEGTGHIQAVYGGQPSVFPSYEAEGLTTQWYISRVLDVWEGFPDVIGDTLDKAESLAKLRALSNMDTTPYAFGEDIGELGETLRLLRNPLSSLQKLSKSFRKSYDNSLDRYTDHAKAFADQWLVYRFGFSPLLRSAADLIDSFSYVEKAPPERLSARGFADTSGQHSDSETLLDSYNQSLTFDRSKEIVNEGHASILYEVSNPVRDWKHRYGLRLKDHPTTLWQLLPYSFMVDRLLDISSFSKGVLNLLDPQVTILAASYRVKSTYTQEVSCISHLASGWTITVTPDTDAQESFEYNRQVWRPSFSDALPDFTPERLFESATHVTDLVSLILANIRK